MRRDPVAVDQDWHLYGVAVGEARRGEARRRAFYTRTYSVSTCPDSESTCTSAASRHSVRLRFARLLHIICIRVHFAFRFRTYTSRRLGVFTTDERTRREGEGGEAPRASVPVRSRRVYACTSVFHSTVLQSRLATKQAKLRTCPA